MVTADAPAASPSVWPLPSWIGTRPRKFGSAKLVCPFPPYVVPSSEKRAWFWLMGKSWPLQRAQPLGGKLKLTIFISLRNGSDISLSLADVLRERVLRLDEFARTATRGREATG